MATADRDLLTGEVSPVAGTTTHAYNEHGELITTTDARGAVTQRTIDPLDRVTAVTLGSAPGAATSPAISYTYDDPGVPFSLGRLTAITRDGVAVPYAYDRYGRPTQDGELTYGYDVNGNRTTIGYPGGVTATYGYDFADRPSSLAVTNPPSPAQTVVVLGDPLSGRRSRASRLSRPSASLVKTTWLVPASSSWTTDSRGGLVWSGGFEPFGADWQAGAPAGSQEKGIFLPAAPANGTTTPVNTGPRRWPGGARNEPERWARRRHRVIRFLQ